jgi:8-oxo-dGTP diphosphatase
MELYSNYIRYLVAVDCIVFGYDIFDKELKLLLIKRSFDPMKGSWSLPGGFVGEDESLDEAASRILGFMAVWKGFTLSNRIHTERQTGTQVQE